MSGAHEDEIIRLRLLSAAHPNARILTHLAEAYRKAGDLERAREAAERAIERHAEYPNAHMVRGRVLWELADTVGAERAFRRVLDLDPEHLAATECLDRLDNGIGPDGESATDALRDEDRAAATASIQRVFARHVAEPMKPDERPPVEPRPPEPRPPEPRSLEPRTREPRPFDSRMPESPTTFRPATDRTASGAASWPWQSGRPAESSATPEPAASDRPVGEYFAKLLSFTPAPRQAPPPAWPRTVPDETSASFSPSTRQRRPRPQAAQPRPAAGGAGMDVVALVDLLTGLLEYRDPFYRGGSSLTRLIATALGREMGLDGEALEELALAALLRDLGRLALGGRLIEKPSVELGPEARRRIEGHVDLALKLLDGIALPDTVRAAIRHHHERWDGMGYPDGLRKDAIPLPARILAVADSLAAMISPRPYRPPRRFAAAVAEIEAQAGSNYDPAVVHALMRILPGRLRRRALGFGLRQHVVVVDADRGRALAVAVRLCSNGYLAEAASDPDEARERMRRYPADALIIASDVAGDAASAFLDALRDDDATAATPVVMLNAETVERRIELLGRGADVCFAGDVAFDELRAALGALLKRSSMPSEPAPNPASSRKNQRSLWHTLQGDLKEFPLSWLLQVLNYDARTAAIVVRSGGASGTIYVEGGAATHAEAGELAGDAALQAMLRWKEGSFVVQPNARAALRTVERSIMHLLLDTAVEDDHSAPIFGAVRTDE